MPLEFIPKSLNLVIMPLYVRFYVFKVSLGASTLCQWVISHVEQK